MIPAEFDYVAPDSLDEALAALRDGGEDAKLLAGGHSLLPLMKLRLAAPTLLVDLRKVPGLDGIQRTTAVRDRRDDPPPRGGQRRPRPRRRRAAAHDRRPAGPQPRHDRRLARPRRPGLRHAGGAPRAEGSVTVSVAIRDPDYTPELQGRLGKLEAAISKQRTVRFAYWSIAATTSASASSTRTRSSPRTAPGT